jgi:hypothetical protein
MPPTIKLLLNPENEFDWSAMSVENMEFGNHLGGLQVMEWDGEAEALTPVAYDRDEFYVVAATVHLGIRLLETKRGQEALTKLGSMICQSHVATNKYDRELFQQLQAKMHVLVKYYLSALREVFFPVVIVPREHIAGSAAKIFVNGVLDRRDNDSGSLQVALRETTIAVAEVISQSTQLQSCFATRVTY